MDNNYLMKVDDFDTNFVSSISLLRDSEEFFDVTLVSDDEIPIQAHKVILSASSSFFRNVLKFNSGPSPLLYIRGVSSTVLTNVVEFLYKGETTVTESDLDTFLKLSEDLKVTGLSDNDEVNPYIWTNVEEKENQSRKKTTSKKVETLREIKEEVSEQQLEAVESTEEG